MAACVYRGLDTVRLGAEPKVICQPAEWLSMKSGSKLQQRGRQAEASQSLLHGSKH